MYIYIYKYIYIYILYILGYIYTIYIHIYYIYIYVKDATIMHTTLFKYRLLYGFIIKNEANRINNKNQ